MDAITALVRAKGVTRELGEGVVPEPIRRFVLHEFGLVANTDVPRLGPEARERRPRPSPTCSGDSNRHTRRDFRERPDNSSVTSKRSCN